MPARGFYYDDCRSADRLAREYTTRSGVTPIQYYDSGRHWYRWVGAGAGYNYSSIESFNPSKEFEMSCLIKKNVQAPVANQRTLTIVNYMNYNSVVDAFRIQYTDTGLFAYLMYNSVAIYVIATPIFTNDVIYRYRTRYSQNAIMSKAWEYGTSEPNWILNARAKPIGYKSVPSKVALGVYSYQAGDIGMLSDIRITPIRRTGP